MASLGRAGSARWVLMALLATGAFATPGAAIAQEQGEEAKTPRERARELYAIGLENFERGAYKDAIAAYEKAFALVQVPAITFNIGLSYEKLGRPVDAVRAMEKVISAPGNLKPVRLEQARATMAAQKALIAELDVSCNVTGARVKLGDDEVGTIPLPKPIPVAAGKVVIVQATKSGYQAGRTSLAPPGGQKVPVVIELDEADKIPAQLEVSTTLPEGELYVDGELVAITPVRTSIALRPDVEHRIELRRKGYLPATDRITLSQGGKGSMTLQPQEDRNAVVAEGGELVLKLVQPDASVFVNGQRREVKDGSTLRLPPGRHLIAGERDGYDPLNLEIDIPTGGRLERTIDLIPTPATRADLIADAEYWNTLGWGLTIGGAVFAGVGTGLVVWSVGRISDGEAQQDAINNGEPPYEFCADNASSATDPERRICDDDRNAGAKKADNGRVIAGLAGVGATLGVASLVTGIVFIATGEDADQYRLELHDDVFALRLEPSFVGGPGYGMVGLSGSF